MAARDSSSLAIPVTVAILMRISIPKLPSLERAILLEQSSIPVIPCFAVANDHDFVIFQFFVSACYQICVASKEHVANRLSTKWKRGLGGREGFHA